MSNARKKFLEGQDDHGFENLIRITKNEYKPNKKGLIAHKSLNRTKILRGGLGSGKTRCATEHINQICLSYPGASTLIGRRDLPSLKETTQKEFLEKVVTPETIETFHVNDNKLYYKNGSSVIFRELKDPDKAKSLEISAYMIDEADENKNPDVYHRLDERLRQKFTVNGETIFPPYAGLLVLNPCSEEHWIYDLANSGNPDVLDIQFSTYDNIENLPPDYIQRLIKSLPVWEVDRLVHGNWGRVIRGNPVIHGFGADTHAKAIKFREDLPIFRGWDFGYSHPACSWVQHDPFTGQYLKHYEFLGRDMYIPQFVEKVKQITKTLPPLPIFDFGDPHGADKSDKGASTIEYIRKHHNISIQTSWRFRRIRTGLEEIQHKVLQTCKLHPETDEEAPLFLVHPRCKISIAAYCGGYHRDEEGEPVKDGYYDHIVDTDRYIIMNTMTMEMAKKYNKKPYRPRNRFTGY